jgi:hypothetical protein
MESLVPEGSELFLLPKKDSTSHDYNFLVEWKSEKDEEIQYRHDLLGLPNTPVLGRYSGAGYEFGKILSLASIDLRFNFKENKQWGIANKDAFIQKLNIPDIVSDLLLNIPYQIEENKKIDEMGNETTK